MRLFLKKRTPDQIEFGIIYGSIALLMLIAASFLPVLSFAPHCVFKGLTGLPCPACGSTRSMVHLSHGELLSAFIQNPLISLCIFSATVYFIYSLMSLAYDLPRIGLLLTDDEKNGVRAGVIFLLLANWMYLIAVN